MKKLIFPLLVVVLLLLACNDGGEKAAQERLRLAQRALSLDKFNEAKLQIDSIKVLYPKAFKARKEGIKLMQQVELKEQQQSLHFLDSVLHQKQLQLDSIRKNYILEKDEEYQQIGNYFAPSQIVEKNINRTYLRAQADERGMMILTSIYCRSSNIHHHAVRVTAPDGSFAQTPSSKDSYESTDLGMKIEKADFKLGEDGDVIPFIAMNAGKKMKVEYLGDKSYSFILSPADSKAIASVYELATLLSSMEQIRKEIKEANLKIDFITRKMQESK